MVEEGQPASDFALSVVRVLRRVEPGEHADLVLGTLGAPLPFSP